MHSLQPFKQLKLKAMIPLSDQLNMLNCKLHNMDYKINTINEQVAKLTNQSVQHTVQEEPVNSPMEKDRPIPTNKKNSSLYGQGRVRKPPTLILTTAPLQDQDLYNNRSYSQMAARPASQQASRPGTPQPPNPVSPDKPKANNPAFNLARRCQGFHPLTSRDIGREKGYRLEIEDEELQFQEAGKACIRDFLQRQMGISERIAKDIRITSVFFPPLGASSATLFAEFHSEEEVQLIRSYARNLTTTEGYKAKLVIYIPRSLHKIHSAVEAAAFRIRDESKNSVMTRIWIGTDLELRAKKKGDPTSWASITPIELHNLPPQTAKRVWSKIDMVEKRTPITPLPDMEEITCNISTQNRFQVLGADSLR